MQSILKYGSVLMLLSASTPSWAATAESSEPNQEAVAAEHRVRFEQQPRVRFDLGLDIGMNLALDQGQRFFTGALGGWKLGVHGRLGFRLGRRSFLGAVLGYTGYRHTVAGELVDTHESQLSLRELEAGVRFGGVVHPGIELFSQILAGPSFQRVRFAANPNSLGLAGTFADQRDVSVFVDAQLGAALYFPQKWLRSGHVVPGTSVSFGYRFRPEIELDQTAQSHSASGVTVRGPELEPINMSGLVWSWGLFVRFR